MGGRLSGANNPDTIFVQVIRVRMNHKKDGNRTDHPDRVPSLFTVHDPIRDDDVQSVVPDQRGEIESYPMFREVPSRLFRVPIKLWHCV